MSELKLYAGERYRHYKGKLYQVVAVAVHTETEEELVIYQALYGDYKVFARPLKMFFENVKDDAGNEVPRFAKEGVCVEKECISCDVEPVQEIKEESIPVKVQQQIEGVNPLLIEFLDAESSAERLEVLHRMRKTIDNKTISDIAGHSI